MLMNWSAARRRAQVARDAVEIGSPPALADGFDHLDRRDGVELLGRLAIVLEANFDPVASPASAILRSAQAFCSVESVSPTTDAPRFAASIASVPQPQPISSRRCPGL